MSYYYCDYHTGKFPFQKTLNRLLDSNGSTVRMQADAANPLTLRLLVAADALRNFRDLISTSNQQLRLCEGEIQQIVPASSANANYWSTGTTNLVTTSGIACPVAYYEDQNDIYSKAKMPQTIKYQQKQLHFVLDKSAFSLWEAHKATYSYFSSYGSVVDRFAQEVNDLFSLGFNKDDIYWKTIVSNEAIIEKKLKALSQRIVQFNSSNARPTLLHRNRIVHDGLLSLSAEVVRGDWSVLMPRDPNNPANPSTVDALKYISTELEELLRFLDDCYALINQHVKNSGNPPW